MGPFPLALLLAATLALAWAVSRYAARRRGIAFGDGALAAVVAVPFAAIALVPVINNDDHREPKPGRWPGCYVERSGSDYVVRPARCRAQPPGRLVPGKLDMYVDSAGIVHGRAQVIAWAGDVKSGRPADAVLVQLGGRLIAAVRPTMRRPDLVKTFHHEALREAGFGIALPIALSRDRTLRFSAVLGRRVAPLRFDCSNDRLKFGCPGTG